MLFAAGFATIISGVGFLLIMSDASEAAGGILLFPGGLAEFVHKMIRDVIYPGDNFIDDLLGIFIALVFSWVFYFGAFYLIARWRAGRAARKQSTESPRHT